MSVANLIREAEERNGEQQNRPRHEVTWSEARIFIVKVIENDPVHAGESVIHELEAGSDLAPWVGCLMIGIKKSDHRDFPMYRCSGVGTVIGEGRFVPSFSPKADLQQLRQGQVHWDSTFERVTRLMTAVKEWLDAEQSWNVDHYVARRGDRPVQEPRRTGKTERARAKGKARPKAT